MEKILRWDLLFYFAQYILKAQLPYLSHEYEGLTNKEIEAKNREIILRTNAPNLLLAQFIQALEILLGESYPFYKVQVNWDSPSMNLRAFMPAIKMTISLIWEMPFSSCILGGVIEGQVVNHLFE
ncbi:MAG: hypothetical protein GYB31_01790 [Bacteroidetes bacterium]|nr:hypothetical protein [Bacteroidota bacterium]